VDDTFATSGAPDLLECLVLDLLEWVGDGGRPAAEVLEAWRTSCPRLPVWEEATRRALVERRRLVGEEPQVVRTPAGRALLRRARPAAG